MPLLRSAAEERSDLGGARLDDAQVEFVVDAGLGPLLNHIAQDDKAALSHASRTRLAGADMAGEARYSRMVAALGEILVAHDEIAHGVTLLKGISVCRRYPRPHLRTMSDIDLLASPRVMQHLENLLPELGYQPGEFGMGPGFYRGHHHTRPFVHPVSGVRIEVHRALFPSGRKIPDDSALGIERARTQIVVSAFEGHEVRRFGPEMELLYIAAHWAYDLHLPLVHIGLLDALYLIRDEGEGIDWDLIGSWFDAREVATPLCVLLGYLLQHRLIDLDPTVITRLEGAPKCVGRTGRRALHRIVDRSLDGGLGNGSPTRDVLEIVWQALVAPASPWTKLYTVPMDVAFPPHHPSRFSPAFQLQRFRSLFFRQPDG